MKRGDMDRHVFVLGTFHTIQGAEKRTEPKNIHDPAFETLIDAFFEVYGVDYVFEEASELGPTIASKAAASRGVGYTDVDPHVDNRSKFGLAANTGEAFTACIPGATNTPNWGEVFQEHVTPQADREKHWVKQISSQTFADGLVICGFLHTLSLANRLHENGIDVTALTYSPDLAALRALAARK
jgi:hypothetical protein